jgi:hypothetical protein
MVDGKMQTSYSASPAQDLVLESKYPFPEIQFLRLIVWKECQSQIKPFAMKQGGGQAFNRFALPFMPGVSVDFCSRGTVLSPGTAMALQHTLSFNHVVAEDELYSVDEVVSGQWVDPLAQAEAIEHAEVGDLNGRPALAIQWTDSVRDTKHISLFLTAYGDGRKSREIHFSAPAESFDLARKYFSELLRSLQWYA